MAAASCSREERWSLTGATAIVEELAGFGARVHTCARNAAELEACHQRWAEKGLQVTVSVCDVAIPAERNLQGQARHSDDTWLVLLTHVRLGMATNLESCLHLSQLARPLLCNASLAGGGSIVNISSIGSYIAYPGITIYSVTKGGMNQLTRSLAVEWACDKIRVNAVAPGVILTDMVKEVAPEDMDNELKRVPMRRGVFHYYSHEIGGLRPNSLNRTGFAKIATNPLIPLLK